METDGFFRVSKQKIAEDDVRKWDLLGSSFGFMGFETGFHVELNGI